MSCFVKFVRMFMLTLLMLNSVYINSAQAALKTTIVSIKKNVQLVDNKLDQDGNYEETSIYN